MSTSVSRRLPPDGDDRADAEVLPFDAADGLLRGADAVRASATATVGVCAAAGAEGATAVTVAAAAPPAAAAPLAIKDRGLVAGPTAAMAGVLAAGCGVDGIEVEAETAEAGGIPAADAAAGAATGSIGSCSIRAAVEPAGASPAARSVRGDAPMPATSAGATDGCTVPEALATVIAASGRDWLLGHCVQARPATRTSASAPIFHAKGREGST